MRTEIVYYGQYPFTVSEDGTVWDAMGNRLRKITREGLDNLLLFKNDVSSGIVFLANSFLSTAFGVGTVEKAPIRGQFILDTDTGILRDPTYNVSIKMGSKFSEHMMNIDHAVHHMNPATRIAKKSEDY